MKPSVSRRVKERWLHIIYGYLGKCVLKLIGYTCRFRFSGVERFVEAASSKKCILMFWHNRLMMAAEILSRIPSKFTYAALISNSRDGEVIAVLTNSYSRGRSIRVPHNARSAALKTLIKEMKNTNDVIIITPDGPRGPPCKVKKGIVLASKAVSAHVVPLTWKADRFWKLPTWDGLVLPKPFSTIQVNVGPPITLSKDFGLSEGAKCLEDALMSLEIV